MRIRLEFFLDNSFLIFFCLFTSSLSQNLILNPGCEDTLVNGEIPHWTEVVGTNWTQRTASPAPYEGLAYFFPGVATLAELQQDVDISAYKTTIDDSTQLFIFEGYVRAYPQSPADQSRIVLEFLDSLKTAKIDSFDSGNYSITNEWVSVTDSTIVPPHTRHIRIRLISTRRNGSNNDGYYDDLSLVAYQPVGILGGDNQIPKQFHLYQNYPNPFNVSTVISWELSMGSPVTLVVYDLSGRRIMKLLNKHQPAGYHQIEFDASHLPSGIYLYHLQAGDYQQTRNMIFMK
ncbi:MAG: T9SS type A sorting domain-containing protein [Calditrichaeota bacterium]|nr:T9SS type A sorting domain-containing protein [Calditrichota bacterium]